MLRLACRVILVCLSALASVVAQSGAPVAIVANQNRTPAGKLESGVLNVQLEIVQGGWHAEAEDGPRLNLQAFGEAGHPAQIPGPLLRAPQGTTIHVTVANKVNTKVKPDITHDDFEVASINGKSFPFTEPFYLWSGVPCDSGPRELSRVA